MKFNWGTGLAVFIAVFIGTLFFVLFQSTKHTESLVIDNYYEEDLAYQQMMEKKQNTSSLPVKVKVDYSVEEKMIHLYFPEDSIGTIEGKILLYNPLSDKFDISHDFNLGEGTRYDVPTSDLHTGKLKVKIDWMRNGKSYYQEEDLII